MTDGYKNLYQRIETRSNEHNDWIVLEDGYYYFMPQRIMGAISAGELRILANILDEKNREYDLQVKLNIQAKEAI